MEAISVNYEDSTTCNCNPNTLEYTRETNIIKIGNEIWRRIIAPYSVSKHDRYTRETHILDIKNKNLRWGY